VTAGAALTAAKPRIVGCQTPRLLVVPRGRVSTAAPEVIELADQVGLILDPWQRLCLDIILSEDVDGSMAALMAALIVPRQNGKGAVLEALELAWLYLWRTPVILHSAHLFKTAKEGFKRLVTHIRNTPWLLEQTARIVAGNNEMSITLKPDPANGETKETAPRIEFVARSKGGGRGFSANRLVLDEAYDLPDLELDAAMPTLSAQEDCQIILTSSAPMVDSITLRRIRDRIVAGDDDDLAGLEWSVDPNNYDPSSEQDYAKSNPGYNIRIKLRAIRNEFKNMSVSGFARERLGIPDEDSAAAAFDIASFSAAESDSAAPDTRVVLALDASPNGADGAIYACDGRVVEQVAVRTGISWCADLVIAASRKQRADVVIDPSGPAGALVPHLEPKLGKRLRLIGARDKAQACGAFDEALKAATLTVRRSAALRSAVESSRRKKAADELWTLRRAAGGASIAPAYAAVFAFWGATNKPPRSMGDQVF